MARERASVSSAPSGAGEGEVARSRRTPPARAASSVASPHSSQHAPRCGELGEVSEDRSLPRSSRVSRSSEQETRKNRRARTALVTVAVVLALAPSIFMPGRHGREAGGPLACVFPSVEPLQISIAGFRLLLRGCTRRRSRSCCSIQVSAAGSFTGSRGRT